MIHTFVVGLRQAAADSYSKGLWQWGSAATAIGESIRYVLPQHPMFFSVAPFNNPPYQRRGTLANGRPNEIDHCSVLSPMIQAERTNQRSNKGKNRQTNQRTNERSRNRRTNKGTKEQRNDERRTTNDERRTTNDERRTTNGERRTTNDEQRTTNERTNDERTPKFYFVAHVNLFNSS